MSVPYKLNIGPGAAARLDGIAAVLRRPRDVVTDVPGRHRNWEPAEGSLAERDLAERIFPDDCNLDLLALPRSVCSLYIRSGVDYLAGIAALVTEREVMLSPGALARAAFECGVRALLVLDPRVTPRARSARAILDEIVSADNQRRTLKHLVGRDDPSYRRAARQLEELRLSAQHAFSEVSWIDDPHTWRVDGERYQRTNEAARSWSEWRASHVAPSITPVKAEGFYDALSLYTHPQGFVFRHGAQWGRDVDRPYLTTHADQIAKLVLGAHASVMDSLRLLFDYQGWDVRQLDEIAREANALAALAPGRLGA